MLMQQGRGLYVHVPGQGTDRNLVSLLTDVGQIRNPSDVYEHRRLSEAQFHQWQKAVATGKELGLISILADQSDRFFSR
jgi:hypothetical protein